MDFPVKAPRRPDRAATPATCTRALSATEAGRLGRPLRDEGLDTGDALIAGFYTLAARYTAGEPPVVLARNAARNPGRGLTPLALGWDGAEVFRSLCERVHSVLDEGAPADIDAPMSFSFEENADEPGGGLTLAPGRELAVVAREDGSGLVLSAIWDAQLFDEPFIERVLDHLLMLVRSGASEPDRRLDRLAMLDDDERRRILHEWNDTEEPYPRDRRLHQLFEDQAKANPHKVAAVFPRSDDETPGDAERLTYAELDARANHIADLLYRRGALCDELIGIYANRSPAMLAALLGVLKSGAAYLPLDPAFPRDRLAMMLEDAETRFVLAERALKDRVPGDAEVLVIEDLLGEGGEPPPPPVTDDDPEQLAYAIYTSGSTGRPKGVLISHRAAVNFLDTMARRPGLSAQDRLLAVTTLSFDISVLEIFGPLTQGATIVVLAREDAVRPDRIAATLEDHAVTVMQATPDTWRMLIEDGWRGDLQLRVLCGGEPLPAELAHELLTRSRELWNLYGPTETTVWSTLDRVLPDEPITIGYPVGNTTVYILDEHKQPVPVGVVGELYIGGDGVARGYRGRPELTRERFVPDPFDPRGAARMYRTGDLARFREDGRVAFLGRSDFQVKIRGFRIELGEIETVLERVPGIVQAVVVAREMAGLLRLVAYLRADKDAPDDGALRLRLKERLPDYMVPSAFMRLERFPLTPNNKVDRQALPDPAEIVADDPGRAAVSDTEKRLLRVWREVLALPGVQVEDSFFDHGGDSLLAVRLFSRIEDTFGVRLGPDALLEAPSVVQLARRIDDGDEGGQTVVIQTGDARPPIYCISGIGGHSVVFRALAERTDRDRRFLGLSWPGLGGRGEPHDDIVSIAQYFVSKIIDLSANEPVYLAGYSFGGLVAYEIAVELTRQGHEVALLALIDVPGPLLGVVGEKLSRLSTHYNNLQKRSVRDRGRYVARWFRVGLPRLVKRSESYYELVEDAGKQNESMRRMVQAHDRAQRNYQPRHYAGHGLLVRAVNLPFSVETKQAPLFGWEGLFGQGLEIVELKAPHMEILHEPWVGQVAGPFSRALARADEESQARAANGAEATTARVVPTTD